MRRTRPPVFLANPQGDLKSSQVCISWIWSALSFEFAWQVKETIFSFNPHVTRKSSLLQTFTVVAQKNYTVSFILNDFAVFSLKSFTFTKAKPYVTCDPPPLLSWSVFPLRFFFAVCLFSSAFLFDHGWQRSCQIPNLLNWWLTSAGILHIACLVDSPDINSIH